MQGRRRRAGWTWWGATRSSTTPSPLHPHRYSSGIFTLSTLVVLVDFAVWYGWRECKALGDEKWREMVENIGSHIQFTLASSDKCSNSVVLLWAFHQVSSLLLFLVLLLIKILPKILCTYTVQGCTQSAVLRSRLFFVGAGWRLKLPGFGKLNFVKI